MLFKSVPYRLGNGKNLHGRADGDGFRLLYLGDDGEGKEVVVSKNVVRRAGFVEAKRGDEKIDAKEAVWLGTKYFVSRGEKQVKILSNV